MPAPDLRQRAFSTTNRAPESFAAVSKSDQLKFSADGVEMLLGREAVWEMRFLAVAADFDIVVFVPCRSARHGRRKFGIAASFVLQRRERRLLRRIQLRHMRLETGHLRLQRLGQRQILLAHRLADLFRDRIAALLRLLQFEDRRAALVVERNFSAAACAVASRAGRASASKPAADRRGSL